MDIVALWFDHRYAPDRGYAYVGASRVRQAIHLYLMGKVRRSDWLPVGLGDDEHMVRGSDSESSHQDSDEASEDQGASDMDSDDHTEDQGASDSTKSDSSADQGRTDSDEEPPEVHNAASPLSEDQGASSEEAQ